jgi:outer membrane protein OmpA-like peptidoglycan-associated protein
MMRNWPTSKFPLSTLLVLIVLDLAGCASEGSERITLLPNKDGSASAVVIKTDRSEQILDKPFSSVNVDAKGDIFRLRRNARCVNVRYLAVIAAQPKRPKSYLMYFTSGTTELTEESKSMLRLIKSDLKSRGAPEIRAIGHTSASGDTQDNEVLSIDLAINMRKVMISEGIPEARFTVVGHGERELLISTPDGVDEPRNYRVEINIR